MPFVLHRVAARVLCFDPEQRLLLIRSHDPADPRKQPWWELPGGGIDPGEDAIAAIERELREEAGVLDAEIGPCVWTQHAQFRFAGWEFDQHERIHTARCTGRTVTARHLEAFEALAFEEQRWWPVSDLLADTAPTVPPRLREFLPEVVAGLASADPQRRPVDISPV
ncbi:MAG: NUDIX domain-containing protein [Microthrixaceae bacterium]